MSVMDRSITRRFVVFGFVIVGLALIGLLIYLFPIRHYQRYKEALKRLERLATVKVDGLVAVDLNEKKVIEHKPTAESAADFTDALGVVNGRTRVAALKLDERDWVGYWDKTTNVVPVGERTSKEADEFVAAVLKQLPEKVPNIRSLIVKHSEIDGGMLETIGRLRDLESLALVGPWGEGALARLLALKELTKLTRLTIVGEVALQTEHLRILGSLTKLEQLNLLVDLSDASLAELGTLAQLRVLVLRGSKLPHDSLPGLPQLEQLSLGGGPSGELSHVLRNLPDAPRLKTMSLSRFAKEDRAAVLQVLEKVPALDDVKWTSLAELIEDPKLLAALRHLCTQRPTLKLGDHDSELASLLNASSWSVVKRPLGTEKEYALAHDQAVLAVEQRPGDSDIKNTLGAALFRIGRLQEAKDVLDDTCRRSKGHPADHACLALVHLAMGDQAGARRHLASARDRSMTHPTGRLDPDTPSLIDEVEKALAK